MINDIAEHIHQKEGMSLCYLSADETFSSIEPYLEPLIEFFKTASSQDIQAFRKQGSSLAAVKQQSFGMEAYIHEKRTDFCPNSLKNYLDSRDEAGTNEAAKKVRKIHSQLSAYVIETLKNYYGTDDKQWWKEGIPMNIRVDCTTRWEKNNRDGVEEGQLNLIHYRDICLQNWNIFKDVISFDEPDKQNKNKNTKWIQEFNKIRQITTHPERGVLSKDQVNFVNNIYDKVMNFLPNED